MLKYHFSLGQLRAKAVHFLHTFKRFVLSHPGFVFLVVILAVITACMLRPGFYLMGWDNFSSYLNPKTNLFNTLFATWREHRGLGVPSDSEITDLPRQLINLALMQVVGMQLADQIYFALTLWGGVLGMYIFARLIARLTHTPASHELIGFLAGFFYLFNLSTLAVYYYPMVMYNTRFFMLPTTFYILLSWMYDPRPRLKILLAQLLVLVIGIGTYMVATLFVTFVMLFTLFLVCTRVRKKAVLVFGIYLALNMFWLLTFANYTIQKSAVVPNAPTFIVINDSELNKSPTYFSFENQAKLRPSFFDSKFKNLVTGQDEPFHRLGIDYNSGVFRWILWIFPCGYLAGGLWIVLKNRRGLLVWLCSSSLVFLMLSMKEYSPLGSLYSWMINHVPLASTVFRFGDTKFHAMIAFTGSVVAAIFIAHLLHVSKKFLTPKVARPITAIILGVLVISHIFVYTSYFRGELLGFFMYNKIPSAYFEIANTINADPENARIIHLPFDRYTYWKPYTWGYFGSSFLHFMLNKPLIDRTFEPASEEASRLHLRIMDIVKLASEVRDTKMLDQRAARLTDTLRSMSVKYIIDDQTVGTEIDARALTYWGEINPADTHRVLERMLQLGDVRLVHSYSVDTQSLRKEFASLYPYNSNVHPSTQPPRAVNLYALEDYTPRVEPIQLIDSSRTQSDHSSSILSTDLYTTHTTDSSAHDVPASTPLFDSQPIKVETSADTLTMQLDGTLPAGDYAYQFGSTTRPSVSRRARIEIQGKDALLIIDRLISPQIRNTVQSKSYTDEYAIAISDYGKYSHVKINETHFKLPPNLDPDASVILGHFITASDQISISVLAPAQQYDVSSRLVQLEKNVRCLNDELPNAESGITGDEGILKISGANVSNCLTTNIKLAQPDEPKNIYATLRFRANGTVTSSTSKPRVNESHKSHTESVIHDLPPPLLVEVCMKVSGVGTCLNTDRYVSLSPQDETYVIPIYGNMYHIDDLNISFIVHGTQDIRYSTTITNIKLDTYVGELPQMYTLPIADTQMVSIHVPQTISTILIDVPLVTTSLMSEKGGYWQYTKDTGCDKQTNQSFLRISPDDSLLTYAFGCRVYLMSDMKFSSDRFYLWSIKYTQLSGSRPSIIFSDNSKTYLRQPLLPPLVKPDQYTKVALQPPETLFTNKSTIIQSISENQYDDVSGYIYQQQDLNDTKTKHIIIDTFANNSSIQKFKQIFVSEMPSSWQNLALVPLINSEEPKETAQILNSTRILPSLLRLKINSKSESESVLKFNEQYDSQWILLGAQSVEHMKCDAHANCYKIRLLNGIQFLYILYSPELLSILGIVSSIITAMALIHTFRSAKS
ncbi:MAG: hypothetical protein WCO78_03415 [Candidatus Roizmanbacteria bacterium]